MNSVASAICEFLDSLRREGVSITDIAKALKEVDHRLHLFLQREALEKEDPRIIAYLRDEAPFYYDKYRTAKEIRSWLGLEV